MKLRKQLLLISLVTLALPWAGCQYIHELEHALTQSQIASLKATSQAVSARFSNETDTQEQLSTLVEPNGTQAIYAHMMQAQPILDAYDEEWQAQQLPLETLHPVNPTQQHTLTNVQWVAGEFNQQLYIFIRVADENIIYYSPGTKAKNKTSDHIEITLHTHGDRQNFNLLSSGPGQLKAFYQDNGKQHTEHRIKGRLVETKQGYQVEVAIPIEWTAQGLAINVFGSGNLSSQTAIGNWHPKANSYTTNKNTTSKSASNQTNPLPPLQKHTPLLQHALQTFVRPGIQLHVASKNLTLLASAGDLYNIPNDDAQSWLMQSIFSFVLNSTPKNNTPYWLHAGEFTSAHIHNVIDQQNVSAQLFNQKSNMTAVATPIYNAQRSSVIGAVIVEQSAESLLTITHNVMRKLLLYSFAASLITALALIGFASWLSLRITRLNRAASNAISESGDINYRFPVFTHQDELGELSQSYAELLKRLKEYNLYLKTLASKLSHELRTPLAIVRSSLDNIEQTTSLEEIHNYSQRASEGASRLSQILNAMSSASRLEQAIETADIETVELDNLLQNLCKAYTDTYSPKTKQPPKTDSLSGSSETKHVNFTLDIEATPVDAQAHHTSNTSSSHYKIMGADDLIVQMLDKLIDNAVDFSPANETICIKLYKKNNLIFLSVENKGPLLPEAMSNQLFDSLVSIRTNNSLQATQHLGLGLYIVRLICDFHRANVVASNLPSNNGVIFRIGFPAIDINW